MREAFLRDILDHPEDDAPRLVYANWLEAYGDEHDRARAEFIAVSANKVVNNFFLCWPTTAPPGWRESSPSPLAGASSMTSNTLLCLPGWGMQGPASPSAGGSSTPSAAAARTGWITRRP